MLIRSKAEKKRWPTQEKRNRVPDQSKAKIRNSTARIRKSKRWRGSQRAREGDEEN